jgi:hypothetical protein
VISSPRAPGGLLWTIWKKYFGPPAPCTTSHGISPFAATRALNPSYSQAAIDAVRDENADKAAREHDALFVEDDTSLFAAADVDACTRVGPAELPRVTGLRYVAAIDPAAKLNAFTLVIGAAVMRTRDVVTPPSFLPGQSPPASVPTAELRRHVVVALARQWVPKPGVPLDMEATLQAVAELCAPYGITALRTDGWSSEALRALARRYGIELVSADWTSDTWLQAYEELRTLTNTRCVDLPPDPYVRADLLAARRRTRGTKVYVHLPTTGDGRHCDYAPGLALVAGSGGVGSGAEAQSQEAPEDRRRREEREREERSIRRLEQAARAAREDEDEDDGGIDDDDE